MSYKFQQVNYCGDPPPTGKMNCVRSAYHKGDHLNLDGQVWEQVVPPIPGYPCGICGTMVQRVSPPVRPVYCRSRTCRKERKRIYNQNRNAQKERDKNERINNPEAEAV